jgi:hypothetical protein
VTYLLGTNAISDLMRAAPKIEDWTARADGGRSWSAPAFNSLTAFRCEAIPERAADLYAKIKLARQLLGLSLDENDL